MARAPSGPVVLDGIVSDEKLAELLVLGTEYAELDFKRVIDLGEKRQEVELARDVGGMLVRGGYILAGSGLTLAPQVTWTVWIWPSSMTPGSFPSCAYGSPSRSTS